MVNARHRIDWGIDDPKHMDDEGFRAVRSVIENKVKELIASLKK